MQVLVMFGNQNYRISRLTASQFQTNYRLLVAMYQPRPLTHFFTLNLYPVAFARCSATFFARSSE